MGQIFFGDYVKLENFNLNNKINIEPPTNSNGVKDSIVYSVASSDFYDTKKGTLLAIYKPISFSSDKFTIYRKSLGDNYATYLGTVENITDGIMDYGVASNKKYQYIIQTNPQYNNNISIQTNYLNVHWNKWSIVSLNYDIKNDIYYPDDTVFTFNNNLSAGSISDNMNFIKYNTLDKFGRVMQTPQQYDSGSLTCLFGDFKSVYDIIRLHSLILDETTQTEIRRITSNIIRNRIITLLDKSNAFVQDNMFGYNIVINVYENGKIELIWLDKINNISYCGYTQDSKDKTTEQIAIEIVNMLVNNMSDSFIRRLYCEITYSSSDYENYYIYFSKYDDYYEKNILWEQVRKQYAYYDDDEKMVLWKQFLQDQKVKLLKSPKGDMWIVSISDQTSRDVQYNSVSYPTTISFNWQEIMDKDKISIMSW